MRESKENVVYPARVQAEDGGGVRITFPDFPELLVIAGGWEEGMEQARRQLALAVIDRMDSGGELPAAAGPGEAQGTVGGGESLAAGIRSPGSVPAADLVYLHIWLPYFRSDMREVYVKKSVTIPQWLDVLAKKSGLNFSAALVRGIKEELGIQEKKDI